MHLLGLERVDEEEGGGDEADAVRKTLEEALHNAVLLRQQRAFPG